MASVYRKTVTRPLPADAKIVTRKGERLAQWKDRKGKNCTAPVKVGKGGSERIAVRAATYTAKYRDGQGIVREFIDFLLHNKKWWLTPIILVLLLVTVLIALSGSAAAPFIYTLF